MYANENSSSLSDSFEENSYLLTQALRCDYSFDLVVRDLEFASHRAKLFFADGLVKDETMVKIITSLSSLKQKDISECKTTKQFCDRYIPYIEVGNTNDVNGIVTQVLSGQLALIIEGFNEAIMIDARTYPTRSLQEPDSDRVLRGARDSFCETIIFNTALIRRHIRDARLTMEYHQIGSVSKTDVVICYFKGRVNDKELDTLRKKVKTLNIKTLSMGQESITEALLPKHWYNPFPKVRYTERPDSAAATICEGGIVLMVDGSPSAIMMPTALFDFFQDTNDYYFPPLVGSYLRLTRYLIYFLTLFLIPVWYLLIKNPNIIPPWLEFINIQEMNKVPIFWQLMIVELIVDCLKQASLNTPNALGGSFSVVSALILGDFAVTARWFVPEVLLYMAFVAVANFATPSFELGYALKLCRMMLIFLIALFNIWGFFAGVIIIALLIATTPTITGQSYLSPLIPFDGSRLLRLVIRRQMNDDNT